MEKENGKYWSKDYFEWTKTIGIKRNRNDMLIFEAGMIAQKTKDLEEKFAKKKETK